MCSSDLAPLGNISVEYSDVSDIERDAQSVLKDMNLYGWKQASFDETVKNFSGYMVGLWKVHPFREGNTRTVVMMMTFFVEHYGYHMDQELMAASAGYVRDSFVMASLDQNSEYEHLERILLDAVCNKPISYTTASLEGPELSPSQKEKYRKYQKDDYIPEPHYRREDN